MWARGRALHMDIRAAGSGEDGGSAYGYSPYVGIPRPSGDIIVGECQ